MLRNSVVNCVNENLTCQPDVKSMRKCVINQQDLNIQVDTIPWVRMSSSYLKN